MCIFIGIMFSKQISEVTLGLMTRLSVAASQEVTFNFLALMSVNNCSSVFRLDQNEKYSIENDTGFLIHDGILITQVVNIVSFLFLLYSL